MATSRLRVAVAQFAPKLGDVHANIAKARELCRGLTARSVDLLCFPEMSFSGYMFPDASSIAPHLEHPKTGPTSLFCAELARRLQCYVVAGFPARLDPDSGPTSGAPGCSPDPPSPPPIGANAALLYSPTGERLHTYHKSNLFPVDRTWACAGRGFTTLDLPAPLGRTAVAICNDLNVDRDAPAGWASLEEGPYELAGFCVRERVRVLVLLNAWLKPEEEGQTEEEEEEELEPNWRVLNYWAMRLRPLWAEAGSVGGNAGGTDTPADTMGEGKDARQPPAREWTTEWQNGDHVVVVVCDRFGREGGSTFVGSSAMFSMRPGSGKPRLLRAMGEREEGVCVWAAKIGSG